MKVKKALLYFTLMLIGEGVFLLPFVIPRVFRPTFLAVFDITNLELGTAFSLYGIIAMVSYFVGGPIADRFSPKKLLIVSLLATALAGVIMALIPSLTTLILLYGFWGISTILLFWAGYIKAIRQFGGEDSQGKSYGIVDGGRGLVAAILASTSVLILDAFLPSAENASIDQLSFALSKIIYVFSGVIVIGAVLVWYIFPNDNPTLSDSRHRLSLEGVKMVIKRRSVWLQALILLCGYVGYKCVDDFGLYATDVFGYDDVKSAQLATVSFWVRPFAAIGTGFLADRFGHSKMASISFITLILGGLILSTGAIVGSIGIILSITVASTSLGIYGLRGLYFSLFQESKIPLSVTGSAIGFVSVIGYTPDIFMGPLMGYILDNNPGALGHQYLFGLLVIFGIIGFTSSLLFRRSLS